MTLCKCQHCGMEVKFIIEEHSGSRCVPCGHPADVDVMIVKELD